MKTTASLKKTIALSLLVLLFSQCEQKNKKELPGREDFQTALPLKFQEARTILQSKDGKTDKKKLADLHHSLTREYPVFYDWWLQDGGNEPDWFQGTFEEQWRKRLGKVASELKKNVNPDKASIRDYLALCLERRARRLSAFTQSSPALVFTKFNPLRPSFYAYTEGASDARGECNFIPGGELALLQMDGIWGKEKTLFKDDKGVLRDPCVHFDGDHVLFSWKKSAKEDDFHLYETNLKTGALRQITSGKGCSDIEGIYLPNNNILFNSTRCGNSVDCWFTEVSNLYLCNKDGKYIRQVGFDQVHTTAPALLDDGRVVYTRWDYNDRGQVFVQPLFQMFPDGTGQSAYYGMNSWFPTTIVHPRQIPGTRKIMATIIGHHTPQHGKLSIIDPEEGREENEGITFVAPLRKPEAERIDQYGQYGEQFQYPFPLNQTDFLVSYSPLGYSADDPMLFGIYWMNVNGERELLVSDPQTSCNQPQLAAVRKRPFTRASTVDYTKDSGICYMQNIYEGEGLKGIKPGTVKKLRVVELEFRAAGIGQSFCAGKGGTAHASSPVGVGNASWDLKKVLGTIDVSTDGSALFTVPSRKPLYFQALDDNGYVVQTMRSWSTFQPGEMQSCVGCHEHKDTVPLSQHPVSQAMEQPVQSIVPGVNDGRNFSFITKIQPLLDKNCIRCHDGVKHKMSLKGALKVVDKQSKRYYSESYLSLTHARKTTKWNDSWQGLAEHPEVNWISCMSEPTRLPPYAAGSARSKLIQRLKEGHGKTSLTKEEIGHFILWLDLLVPFVGDYETANNWSDKEKIFYKYYKDKRDRFVREDRNAIKQYIQDQNNHASTKQ